MCSLFTLVPQLCGGVSDSDASASRSGSGSDGSEAGSSTDLSLIDTGAPVRTLAALNALRKSRQHYDVVLMAAAVEVPAHRAVLSAASPYLLQTLAASAASPPQPLGASASTPGTAAAPPAPHYRVEGVDADALQALVDYAYTGRLRVREESFARRVYVGAWRLRVERVRAHLATQLLRRASPATCLELRALPDLGADLTHQLHAYIASHFDAICEVGALVSLPVLRVDILRAESAGASAESPFAIADAALGWLRTQADDSDMEELCSRTHLLYVNSEGALRDCGELPAERGDAPELREYRRDAVERAERRAPAAPAALPATAPRPVRSLPNLELGARIPREREARVLAARRTPAGARVLLEWRGRLTAVHCSWRYTRNLAPHPPVGSGGSEEEEEGARRAEMTRPRCAHGIAELAGQIVVCGGYDRARVLRAAEAYEPTSNTWSALPDMRTARARFPAARLHQHIYVIGGSDGQTELDSVDVLAPGGLWMGCARLPAARSHAAAAADEARSHLYVIGGWAAGRPLRHVARYSPGADAWSEAPSLAVPRSQCAAVLWERALWVLGGCDAWHCLATTEMLPLDPPAHAHWTAGPALPTARRSVGGAVWHGRLVSVGGSDGATSLRRVEWLAASASAWSALPSLRAPRAALGVAVLGNALYAVGGFCGKEFLATVECLYDPDGEWTVLCDPPAPFAHINNFTEEEQHEEEENAPR